jgi:hypothetical protein
VDNQKYPSGVAMGLAIGTEQLEWSLYVLTTPIAYMSSVSLRDPFGGTVFLRRDANTRPIYMYLNMEPIKTNDLGWNFVYAHGLPSLRAYLLWSCGPNRQDEFLHWGAWYPEEYAAGKGMAPGFATVQFINCIYDSTNGTISAGDMGRAGGELHGFKNLPVDK